MSATAYHTIRQQIVGVLQQYTSLTADHELLGESDIPFGQLGVDSLTALSFIQQVNQRMAVSVTTQDLLVHPSLNTLAAYIHQQLEPQAAMPDTTAPTTVQGNTVGALLARSPTYTDDKTPPIQAIVATIQQVVKAASSAVSIGVISDSPTLSTVLQTAWQAISREALPLHTVVLPATQQVNNTRTIHSVLAQLHEFQQQSKTPHSLFCHPLYVVTLQGERTTSNTGTKAPKQVLLLTSQSLAKTCKIQPCVLISSTYIDNQAFNQAKQIGLLLTQQGTLNSVDSLVNTGWKLSDGWQYGDSNEACHAENKAKADFISLLDIAVDSINHGRLPSYVQKRDDNNNLRPIVQHSQAWQLPPKTRVIALAEASQQNEGNMLLLAHRKRMGNASKRTAMTHQKANAHLPASTYHAFDWTNLTIEKRVQINQSQLGLWLLQQANQQSYALNVPISLTVSKTACSETQQLALNTALHHLLHNHPVLRSSFSTNSKTQQVDIQPLPIHDFQFQTLEVSPNNRTRQPLPQQLIEWETQRVQQSFLLSNTPLLRAYYHVLASEVFCFFVIHHTIIDGYSGTLFIKEFTQNYQNSEALTAQVAAHPPDNTAWIFAAQQQAYLRSITAQQDTAFWQRVLSNATTQMPLPIADNPPAAQVAKRWLNTRTHHDLFSFSEQQGLTLPLIFIATLHCFLQRLCDQTQTAFSVVTHGRPATYLQQSIGCFINMMISSAKAQPTMTALQFLQQLQQEYLTALQHAQLPFAEQVRCLSAERTPTGKTCNVNFAYQQFFSELTEAQAITALSGVQQEANDEYSLELLDTSQGIQLQLKSTRYHTDTLAQHLQFYETVLTTILHQPHLPCAELHLAPVETLILPAPKRTQPVRQLSILDALHQHATHNPHALAIRAEQTDVTYQQLWQLVNHYAQQIPIFLAQQTLNQQPASATLHPTHIAIAAERRIETIASFLACWQLGITYVPIPTDCPQVRLKSVSNDAQLGVLLAINGSEQVHELATHANQLGLIHGELDDLKQALTHFSEPKKPEVLCTSHNDTLAYCLFTSGSTGQPKGVQVPLSAVNHYCWQFIDYFGLTAEDKVLQGAALTFDISVEEIFPILCVGGELHLLKAGYRDIIAATQYIQAEHITVVSTVPAVCARLAEMPSIGVLKTVISGGDTLRNTDIAPLLNTVNDYGQAVRVFNTYGPTETTVCATYQELTQTTVTQATLPIGRPIANTQAVIMDSQQQPVVVGVSGELWIHGPGLARGYINQAELSAQHFVQWQGKTWYRTGDFVYYDTHQRIYFIGRQDQQLSIQGFRIETAEVQQLLQQHPSVLRAEVFPVQRDGLLQLACAIQLTEPMVITDEVFTHLPSYMQPTLVTQVSDFPLTSNGKVDISTLKQQVHSRSAAVTTHPSPHNASTPLNDAEHAIYTVLRQLWQEQLPTISDADMTQHSDWFQLGGHSLSAMRLMMRIEQALGLSVPIQVLYENTVLHALSRAITRLSREHTAQCISTESLANYRSDADALTI